MAFDGTGVAKRHRQQTFHTRKEANAHKAEVETTRGPMRDASAGDVVFGSVAQAWLDSMLPRVASGRLKERTHRDYGAVLRRYVLPTWAGVPIGAVTGRTAEAWAQSVSERGLRPQTFKHAFTTFSRVLAYAARHDIIPANPAALVDLSGRTTASGRFEGRALTADQVAAIVEQIERPVHQLVVLFLAYTGLRASELAGLDVGDLTLNGDIGAVRVNRTRRKVRGGWETGTRKSRASNRTVPLDGWLAEMLDDYLCGEHPDPNAPLFPTPKIRGLQLDWDTPIEPHNFYANTFTPAVRAAGLPHTRLHDLRHTFATLQLRNGPPDHYLQVSRWLGHADPGVTLRVYAHVIPQPDAGKQHQVPPPPIRSRGRTVVVALRGRGRRTG
jgi:integrase